MSSDILFDNIVVTDDESAADEWAQQTYDLKKKHLDKQAVSVSSRVELFLNTQIFDLFLSRRHKIRTHFGSEWWQTWTIGLAITSHTASTAWSRSACMFGTCCRVERMTSLLRFAQAIASAAQALQSAQAHPSLPIKPFSHAPAHAQSFELMPLYR